MYTIFVVLFGFTLYLRMIKYAVIVLRASTILLKAKAYIEWRRLCNPPILISWKCMGCTRKCKDCAIYHQADPKNFVVAIK